MSDFISQNIYIHRFASDDSWVLLTPIEKDIKEKIEKLGTPLKKWNIKINYGIKTGFNDAFIIDTQKRDELIAQDSKSAEIIRPILRGRDIKRFGYVDPELWLLYIPWHFPLHEDPTIIGSSQLAEDAFISSYPAIYNHLLKHKKELSNRNKAETGIRYEWYALQRWGANYRDDFYKQKIIYPGLMRKAKSNSDNFPRFTLDNDRNFFFGNDCYFITGNDLEYLWLFLNSSLTGYLFKYYIYSFDETGYKIFTEYFDKIPIPQNYNHYKEEILELIVNPNIRKIDALIYQIVGLTTEEIDEINNNI